MVNMYLEEAKKNLGLLDEQVGKPSVATMPQTTNQAIVLVLKDLMRAIEMLKMEVRREGP